VGLRGAPTKLGTTASCIRCESNASYARISSASGVPPGTLTGSNPLAAVQLVIFTVGDFSPYTGRVLPVRAEIPSPFQSAISSGCRAWTMMRLISVHHPSRHLRRCASWMNFIARAQIEARLFGNVPFILP
jgi:hypothetical protein